MAGRPINDIAQLFSDPQVAAREMIVGYSAEAIARLRAEGVI